MTKKFFFVRHGETDWNEKKLCQGQRDIELNTAGRLEALRLGKTLKTLGFKRICTSPLKRALETATLLQSMIPPSTLQIIDELKERNWGELEGISSTEMYRIEELEEKDHHFLSGSKIESRDAFKSRVLQGLKLALSPEDEPLIVSHGRVFLSLCELLNIPLIRQIPNATLIECTPTEEGWQVNLIKD